jgi:putative transposase
MRKKTFSEEQIALALREVETGTPVTEVCRKMGVSEQSFYRWKKKYMGMGIAELRRLRQLEEENHKLKGIVADLTLDKNAPGCSVKKGLKPAPKRRLTRYLIGTYQVSERRACEVINLHRWTYRYRSRRRDPTPIRMRIRELAAVRVSYGYRRLHVLLRREGWKVNHKLVYRVYREEGLEVRTKKRRKRASALRVVLPAAPTKESNTAPGSSS